MHHQVGVAADRGGEVGVEREGEAIVADIVGGIGGAGHRADGELAQHVELLFAFRLLEHAVEGTGHHLGRTHFEIIANLFDEVFECQQLFIQRFVVDTIYEGLGFFVMRGALAHFFGHLFVGQQHELLDEEVGFGGHFHVHADGLGVLVKLKLNLFGGEVDGVILETTFA